jgi:purine-nucleoside phosphorylase
LKESGDRDPAIDAAARLATDRLGPPPRLVIVLGSGLAAFAEALAGVDRLPYAALRSDLAPTVPGHTGEIVAGRLGGERVWALIGRLHYYEGVPFEQITFLIGVLAAAGCRRVLLTNAAGGIRPDLATGDWMLISDHLNLPGLAGHNPLVGLGDPPGGSRFVDLSDAYSPALRRILTQVAAARNVRLPEGVYAFVAGPNYETPAEIRFLARIGADAVGMSTVPEVLMGRRLGLEVAGLSCIANGAAIEGAEITHEDVLSAVRRAVPTLTALVEGLVARLTAEDRSSAGSVT